MPKPTKSELTAQLTARLRARIRARIRQRIKPKTTPQADALQVVLEHTTLQREKLRVVILHAPGIDYFVVVERLEEGKWIPVKRPLREIFNPTNSVLELAILQLVKQLSEAKKQISRLQKPKA